MPMPDTIKANQANFTTNSLMVMHYHFNTLKADALSNNLFTVSNDQLYDVGGRPQSPYQQQTAFAISPINAISETEYVTLVFRQQLFYSNTGKTVSALYLDAGSGYQQAYWDVPKTFMLDSVGINTLKAKIVYTDASVYESHFVVYVNSVTGNALMGGGGMQTMAYTAWSNVPITASRVHSGTPATGTIQVRISAQNNNQLKKPLIIAEGFDPWNVLETQNININQFMNDIEGIDNYNLQDALDLSGYDIVYLDYANGTDYIQNNAYLLQDVIKWVNNNKTGSEPNVVLGISMGGLVARWAIKDMEDRSETHQVRLNISMDSPHNGAYVPLAAQALVSGTHDFKIKAGFVVTPFKLFSFDDFDNFNNLLNAPAARQMLTYQTIYNPLTNTFFDFNSSYNTFMAAYHTKGLPTLCQNMAISNGSSCGTAQSTAPGSHYININETSRLDWGEKLVLFVTSPLTLFTNYPKFALSGLLGFLPNKTTLSTQIRLRALGNNQNLEIYKAQIGIKRKIFGLINVNTYVINQSYSSGSRLPLDSAPGGGYDINQFTGGDTRLQGHLLQTGFGFIPTVSALDLSTNISNFTYSDLVFPYRQNNTSSYPKASPFSAVKVGFQGNEGHTDFSKINATWLYNKLEGITNDDCASFCDGYSNLSITGEPQICNTPETYSIANLPSGATVTWSIAPLGVATFTTSGNSATFTKINNAPNAVITAIINSPCGSFTLTKDNISLGLPSVPALVGVGSLTVGANTTITFNVPDDGIMEWVFEGTSNNYTYTISPDGYSCQFTPTSIGTYTVKVRSSYGGCGYSAYASATVNCAVVKPDLVIESANLSVSGSNMTINYSVANVGISNAGSFSVGFYLSEDWSFDVGDTYLDSESFGSLAFGSNAMGSKTFPVPTTPMYVLVVADNSGTVDEIYETNNARELNDLAMYRMAPTNGNDTFTVYPNPANAELKISRVFAEKTASEAMIQNNFNVKLLNEKGKVLKEGGTTSNNKEIVLQVADIPNGIYYLHIYEGKKVSKQQVVIAH